MRVSGLARIADPRIGLAVVVVIAVALGSGWSLLYGQESTSASTTAQGNELQASELIQFNRQIRPILSDKCFRCHGPDKAARQAGLRLDVHEFAIAQLETGGAAITPGNLSQSKLIKRISSDNVDFRMPPLESGKSLNDSEIELIRQWIAQGAPWQDHWSFIAPKRSNPPQVLRAVDVRNPIDNFVLARLEREGLKPSPQADRTTLIRRVSLDLTGLPPSIDQIDNFLVDESSDAYEKVVDRLLDSPRYGEHQARYWLDAARYGDTHGLHLDNKRSMWRWRDWVIDAFNTNIGFDQFTVEQLAGDLLSEPTLKQRIATGFNRNHVTTSEGGAINAEYLVKYAADRVETTSTVWLGLTVGCAQCHDHKFDPISQKEYYQLFAYFNNITEKAMDGNRHDPPPIVFAPTAEDELKLKSIVQKVLDREAQLDAPMPEIDDAQSQWQAKQRREWIEQWITLEPVEFKSTNGSSLRKLDDNSILAEGDNPDTDVYEIIAHTDATDLLVIKLEALTHESLPHNGPGRAEKANFVLSEFEVEAVSTIDSTIREKITFVAAVADHEQINGPFLIKHTIDSVIDKTNGWAVEGYNKREDRTALFVAGNPFGYEGGTELHFRLRFETHFKQHNIGRVRLSVTSSQAIYQPLAPTTSSTWHMVGPFKPSEGNDAFTFEFGPEQQLNSIDVASTYQDEELMWTEQPDFVDAKVNKLTGQKCATYVYRVINSPTARSLDLSIGSDDGIKIWVNGNVVLDKNVARGAAPDQDFVTVDLKAGENHLLMKVVNITGEYGFYYRKVQEGATADFLQIAKLIELDDDSITEDQRTKLRRYYRRNHSTDLQALYDEVQTLKQERIAFEKMLPITLVMNERMERRQTFILNRGEYDQPRDEVEPNVPAMLPSMPDDAPPNRLSLAQWLVDPAHPLTARVTVNRFWQRFFGTGIVRTAEDFGSQGEWPSHPALLDWLACEFVDSGWDVKHIMKLIVMSATYQQSSNISPQLQQLDPDNRLLARGPRYRMDAEMIRDQALAASGLLVEQLGGPSVKPYQPTGLWKAVAYPDSDTQVFTGDKGEAQYRRSMYTFWKRTSPPPNLLAFDAPSRETCAVRRDRTNTPLQSLVLLNDPQFVEAARVLAQRSLLESDSAAKASIALAFRLVTAREPDRAELEILLNLYQARLAEFQSHPQAAEKLLSVGDSPRDESIDMNQHAAMTTIAAVIFSLDEAVTKG